ncbi:VOC family protein [Candidatus Enterococcus leclercqii]|uniref:VOC family protein n=1 Tax=Candidatus Enterococcus leclercqii TaxID=1857218 RepID=UPI00137B08DB|nr:VOC family protein [Enterococcus sp. CU9D]KAF1292992.1 hypothetical protein BAU14_09305 [Enterococcus sp. CU9D]
MMDHIELYVNDLEETRKFYSTLLSLMNYQLYQEWEHGFSYRYKTFYIVFVQAEENYREKGFHRKNIGLNHLAFSVDSTEQVDQIRVRMKDFGAKELYVDKFPFAGGKDRYTFFFEDPDRLKLEVVTQAC